MRDRLQAGVAGFRRRFRLDEPKLDAIEQSRLGLEESSVQNWTGPADEPEAEQLRAAISEALTALGEKAQQRLRVRLDQMKGASIGTMIGAGFGLLVAGTSGMGLAAFGSAVGIPIFVLTGLVGAFGGERVARELLWLKRQRAAAAERENFARAILVSTQEAAPSSQAHRWIEDKDHINVLANMIRCSRKEICIRSGFLSDKIVNDKFINELECALIDGVDIWIEYGFSYRWRGDPSPIEMPSYSEAKERLALLAHERAYRGKLQYAGTMTHVKELVIDRECVILGNHNWLSNRDGLKSEKSVWLFDSAMAEQAARHAIESVSRVSPLARWVESLG